ncbi:Os11g0151800 [Oryza sativa Japonica Group]|uniref:Os11g0151800 protein n=2 Tax=Oryza sativa subsp. japonica TaxID=39947 RepID=Q0IUK0_ORYSJ|nr:hypothetical protein EE612_053535 [Oryza sativa]BAF27615.2 Os11g0151800 [Oryza sativa Japonica Group]BAH01180.1 unnamed protein product [Oryza sativa Japonica Group]BAT12720.1 Os11g0151800 [Oryza sativa Japonica Group]|eukprot:NP_001065770.2 Os11g0151800 [Oryza sativa Japonica Group]
MAMAMTNTALAFFLLVAAASLLSLPPPSLAVTSPYVRPKPRATLSLLKDDDDGRKPEQVHISAVGSDKMRVTWITGGDAPATVEYGTTSGQYPFSATGSTNTYSYVLYHSGNIHDVVIGPLQPSTTYFYRCSNDTSRELRAREAGGGERDARAVDVAPERRRRGGGRRPGLDHQPRLQPGLQQVTPSIHQKFRM